MCYNAGASIAAGTISAIVSLILILTPYITLDWSILKYFKQSKEDNRLIACVILGVSTMQWAELAIHLDEDCTTDLNVGGSKFGFLSLLVIQPIAGLIGITEFSWFRGTTRDFIIKIAWDLCFIAWMIFISKDALNGVDYMSTSLNKTVSYWCTADRYDCDSTDKNMCELAWKWDDINQGPRFLLYMAVVMLLPAFALRSYLFYGFILIGYLVILMFVGGIDGLSESNGTLTGGASITCFWFPPIAVLFQLTGIPLLIQKWFNLATKIVNGQEKRVESDEALSTFKSKTAGVGRTKRPESDTNILKFL